MNIYKSLVQREEGSEEVFKKIYNLAKAGHIFPYSAAHMEEVAKSSELTTFLALIDMISEGYAYLPGDLPSQIALARFRLSKTLSSLVGDLEFKGVLNETASKYWEIYERQKESHSTANFRTKLVTEGTDSYFSRVANTLSHTHYAEASQIFVMGRRSAESKILHGIDDAGETFEELRLKWLCCTNVWQRERLA